MLETLKDRSQLGAWMTEHGFEGVAVEVGAKAGENARQWISTWGQGTLYLLDPWAAQDPKIYRERQDWTDFADCRKECEKLASEFPGRLFLVEGLSPELANRFGNDSLDAVYIDANHAFEPAYADMQAWWPKVRKGGLFSGHDCYVQTDWPAFCEVKTALDKFCAEKGLKYHRTPCTSWWIQK